MSVATLNARRRDAGLPLIRFNIRHLNDEDIQDLRDAYAAMYEITETAVGDRRGYWALARGHGYDQDLCHKDSRVFLTWHRAYVYAFEKALASALQWKRNDKNLVLTLPFWDWTIYDTQKDAPNGIPKVIDDKTYPGPDGPVPNPLASARSLYRITSQGLTGADEMTVRYPGRLAGEISTLAAEVEKYLSRSSFRDFSNDFNSGAHGSIHILVGSADPTSKLPGNVGDMSTAISAAYDPIFWLHHCMVDKVWFDWQTRHGNATVSPHVLDTVVYDGWTGRDLIDAEEDLKYIYSDEPVEAAEEVGGTEETATDTEDSIPEEGNNNENGDHNGHGEGNNSSTVVAASPETISIGEVSGPFSRAQLDFHQLRPPIGSYEIRAYINEPNVDADAGINHSSYCGRLILFGHGHCHGAAGHCDPDLEERGSYDRRSQHPLRYRKTRYHIDITQALQTWLASKGQSEKLEITLVTVGIDGRMVSPRSVTYRGVSLATYA